MIIEVYHIAFGDNHKVANVTVSDSMSVNQALEVAFRKTNNIDGSWSKGPTYEFDGQHYNNSDYSEDVEVVAELPVKDGRVFGLRSTSCGDQMKVNGDTYEVDFVGFKKISIAA